MCFYFLKGVLPKSCNPDHIRENIDIFSFQIPEEDVCSLNSLDKGKHYCWNPVAILWISVQACTMYTSLQVTMYYFVRKDRMKQWYINLNLNLILVHRYDKKRWMDGLHLVQYEIYTGIYGLIKYVVWAPFGGEYIKAEDYS